MCCECVGVVGSEDACLVVEECFPRSDALGEITQFLGTRRRGFCVLGVCGGGLVPESVSGRLGVLRTG